MKRFFAAGIIFLLCFGVLLCGQDSSNLYDRMGVITERGLHGAVPEENIDLFSGSLVLRNLDITLPGPNGFDLNIWRVYNSKVNTDYTFGTAAYPQQEDNSWVGYGWMMHMGRLHNPDSERPTIEFPDGRTESTYGWIHDANILITRNFLQLKKYDPAHGGITSLYFQDGTVWVFGYRADLHFPAAIVQVELVTKIIDSYGHEINIEYYSGTPKLKKITDALGRVVAFILDGPVGYGNLDYILVPHGDGYVTYDYTVSQGWGDSAYTKLDAMKPPALDPVSYFYSDYIYKELHQVTTSYGGTITYTFADQEFSYFDTTLLTRVIANKTIQFSAGNTATWDYVYGDYSGTYHINILVNGQTIKAVNGGFTDVYGPESIERAWFFGPQPDSEDGWLSGLLAFKETWKSDGTAVIASSQYVKDQEILSDERIITRGHDWGQAKAALECGGYQTKIGTASQYTLIKYDNPTLRQYGLPSGVMVGSPYNPASKMSSKQSSILNAPALNDVFSLQGAVAGAEKAGSKSGDTFYTKYSKTYVYTFLENSDFAARNMLSFLSREIYFDQAGTQYKDTQWDYFSNGAIQKIRRWKSGAEVLEWSYTYSESSGYPSEITITIDPPGTAGIETHIYRNGTSAKVAKPGYVEYDRTIYADGLIHTETNQHGGTMTFTYDDIGRITRIDMPAGYNPITAAWSQNNVAITRGGNTLTKYWDGMGRNLGFEESGGGVTLYSRRDLDGESRVIAQSKGADNINHKTIFVYNENGQPLQVTDPTGKWTKFAYADNTCTVTDMKGNQKVLTYAHLPGLVTRIVQENTRTDSYYQGENRLYLVASTAESQDPRSQEYRLNGLDQLDYEIHPETGRIDYQYNTEGNLATKTWSDTTMTYTYNPSNQLLSEDDGAETVSFIYDTHGRVQETNTNTGLWRRYDIAYNELGAMTSEKQAINGVGADKTVAYHYDGNGLLDELTYPDGRKAAYGNNALLLPESLAFNNDSNRVSSVTYGVNKQPLGYNLANGAMFAATYDEAGRIITSGLKKDENPFLAATYGYDEVGNISSLTNTTPAADASFIYDAFNRLTKATYPEKTYDYIYDPFGNMLTAKENSLNVFNKTYTAQNRVSGLAYDGRGNLIQGEDVSQVWDKRNRLTESWKTSPAILLGRFGYNERGLRVKAEHFSLAQPMIQVVKPNGGESMYLGALDTISWTSTGLTSGIKLELLISGQVAGTIAENLPATQTSYQWKVGKTTTGFVSPGADFKVRVSSLVPSTAESTTYYFYDSGNRLLAEYDQAGACVKDYLYLGGKLVGEYQPDTGRYLYYASDQINSTRLVTDTAGVVVHSAQYDPFGGLYKTWVDTFHPKPGFSGKEREANSELDYFGARYYGHKQYRFLSVDTTMNKNETLVNPQLWNLYSYCRNNPITFIDPHGNWEEGIHDLSIRKAFYTELMNHYGLSSEDVDIIVNSNNEFDVMMQGDGKNFYHAMRDKDQSIEEAKRYRDQTANALTRKIIQSRENRFKNGDTKLWSKQELEWFGELQHLYVDETCSSHCWKEWKGYFSIGIVGHAISDFIISDEQLDANIKIIRQLFIQLSEKNGI